ncbi:MAG: ATP-binding cassette domain-containing protein [Castellaniella sp.]
MALLELHDLRKYFGGLKAVDGVSMEVHEGELLGLIGPNGSGKTTVLNLMSGYLALDAGRVLLRGEDITGMTPEKLAHRGLLRMFQTTRVFNRMTTVDNMLVTGLALGLDEAGAWERALALLADLKLEHVMYLDAGHLSGGQRKLLEFGMCFMVPPQVALLDEPFSAVHPTLKQTMADFIRARNAAGQTFILVSHDMPVIVELCPRAVCMNLGKVLAEGPTQEVLHSVPVIEAYLGDEIKEEQDAGHPA